MHATAEQLSHETQKSFDPLASVDLFQYDLENFGQVLPETRERVYDQELSHLAEGVDRAARTPFVLKREGDDLVYFHEGKWRPYIATLDTGYRVAEAEAQQDPRRQFLLHRSIQDMKHYYKFRALQPGQQYSWYSPYAHREEALYGEQFIDDCGLVSARKMGFIYQATGQEDGSVLLESQTVDNSDEDAFEAVEEMMESNPEADLDDLTQAYDDTMMRKYGEYYFAGRRDTDRRENAWEAISQHQQLVDYHLNGLERIAALQLPRAELRITAKKHVYGVWAAFKKRMDGTAWVPQSMFVESPPNYDVKNYVANRPTTEWQVAQEVRYAYHDFAKKGEVMVGCGGSISASGETTDIMDASPKDVFASIFGKNSKSDDDCEFMSKECPECHVKNVWTKVTKHRISGSCGCSKAR